MSEMRIKTMVLGGVQTNCYLVYHEKTKAGVIIDPAAQPDRIDQMCLELGIKPEALLLTHGHGDHIMAVEKLKSRYQIPVIAGEKERNLLADPSKNLSAALGMPSVSLKADREVTDGEILVLAGFQFQVLATPGHTAGSVCYLEPEEGVLFSGDTLFEESLGRTDFPTGNMQQIVASIAEKLFVLPEDIMVYPGHGNPTTIGHEKTYNPVAIYRR